MNAEQYYKHFELVKEDELIKELRSKMNKCKKPGEKTKFALKIYNRSNELKEKVILESSEMTIDNKRDFVNFGKSIDAYLARKVSA